MSTGWTRVGLGLGLAVALGGTASAQYRQESPATGYRAEESQVLAPPARKDPDAGSIRTTETFRRWYAGAHNPAVLIFWNRELTDEATTQYTETQTTHENVQVSGQQVGDDKSPMKSNSNNQSKTSSQEASRRATTGREYAQLDPMLSARLQTAFQQAWLATNVELVDRAAIIRKMAAVGSKDDRADVQLLEAAALEQGIVYLIEVLPNLTAQSPTGITFIMKVKHLPSSTIVAQFLSNAQPPPGEAHWVATSGGFVKRSEDRTSPETIGAELAIETMARLAH